MTGLRSSSATSGRSSASLEIRSSTSASAAVSTAAEPRCPNSSGAARTLADHLVSHRRRSAGQAGPPCRRARRSRRRRGRTPRAARRPASCTTPTSVSTPPASIGCTSTRRRPSPNAFSSSPYASADLLRGAQVQLDRASVGLVHQAIDFGLEHDLAAEFLGGGQRAVHGRHGAGRHDRDPVARQQLHGVAGGQPAAVGAVGQERGHQRAGRRHVDVVEVRDQALMANRATRGTWPRGRAPWRRSPGSCRPARMAGCQDRWPSCRWRSLPDCRHATRASRLTDSGRSSSTAAIGLVTFAVTMAALRSAIAVGTAIASTASTLSSAATMLKAAAERADTDRGGGIDRPGHRRARRQQPGRACAGWQCPARPP